MLSTLELLRTFLLAIFSTLTGHAYRKHHSTEAVFLYIHDHIINAIGSQKISCLCLLDHSVAFRTIDHILITRLSSWFGLHGSVLEWFKLTCLIADFMSNVKTVFLILSCPLLWCSPKFCFWSSSFCLVYR